MHIGFWSPAWPLDRFQNGIVTYVHWMKRELEHQGHRVSVFTPELASSFREVGVYRIERSLLEKMGHRFTTKEISFEQQVVQFAKVIAAGILRVHHRIPIDILDMEESFGWFSEVQRITSIPLLVRLHGPAFLSMIGGELDTPLARDRIAREGVALRLASAIAAPSVSTLRDTVAHYRLAPRICEHIRNPVPASSDSPLWRLETCDRDTILFVGRFDARKGGDVVLQAFEITARSHPHLKLVFVGPDVGLTTATGPSTRFEDYCRATLPASLRPRIDFRGPMSYHEIEKLRVRAMVTLVASRWESSGYTVLETMLQGCPLVCTDAGACPESVVDRITGRLAKSEDPLDFADKLCAVLNEPDSAAAMGRAARRFVLEQHSAATIAAASVKLYESLIGKHTDA